MAKKNNLKNSVERSALNRMKTESSSNVLGDNSRSEAANSAPSNNGATDKMIAKGEIESENLGNATISNKYNS